MRTQNVAHTAGPLIYLAFWQPRKPKRKSGEGAEVRAPKAHINDLIDGRLYMNAAGCCHGLPGEQGDPLEASLAYGVGIYAHWILPTYCMFAVRESDIVVSAVVITGRMNNKTRCSDGWISIVRHDSFEQPQNRNSTLEMTSPHGPVRSSML